MVTFPSWWTPNKGEPPIRFLTEASVPKGYIHVPGDYNFQTGQWVVAKPEPKVEPAKPAKPQLDHDGDGKAGGSLPDNPPAIFGKSRPALLAIARAEGVEIDADAKARDIQAAIKAKRAL